MEPEASTPFHPNFSIICTQVFQVLSFLQVSLPNSGCISLLSHVCRMPLISLSEYFVPSTKHEASHYTISCSLQAHISHPHKTTAKNILSPIRFSAYTEMKDYKIFIFSVLTSEESTNVYEIWYASHHLTPHQHTTSNSLMHKFVRWGGTQSTILR